MARQNVRDAVADSKNGSASSEVATVDPAAAVLDHIGPAIEKQLPAHIKPEYFLRTALTMMRGKSGAALARCDRPTLYAALLEAARHGLMPGTDEAAIVPYGKTATFIPQYQGLVKQMLNSGQVSAVEAHLIHKADQWALAYGDQGGFYHKPALVDDDGEPVDRGPVILAYCYVVLRDGTRSTVTTMTRQEAIEIRDTRSRSYQQAEANGKRNSAWHTDFDPMWLKSVVRKHSRWVPKSPELVELLLAAARDDFERPAGAEPPTPADLGWTVDIGGVVDGEVIDGEIVDNGQAPPPSAPSDPVAKQEPGQRADRLAVLRDIRTRMNAAGLDGPDNTNLRAALLSVLVNPDAPPVPVKSPQSLTLAQAQQAAEQLTRIEQMADQAGKPIAEALQNIAEIALAELQPR